MVSITSKEKKSPSFLQRTAHWTLDSAQGGKKVASRFQYNPYTGYFKSQFQIQKVNSVFFNHPFSVPTSITKLETGNHALLMTWLQIKN